MNSTREASRSAWLFAAVWRVRIDSALAQSAMRKQTYHESYPEVMVGRIFITNTIALLALLTDHEDYLDFNVAAFFFSRSASSIPP